MASASDNFDRADAPIGANWTVDNGSISIVTNVAEPQTAGDMNRARYTATAMDTSNHYAQALIGRGAAGSNQGAVTVRQASATWTHYSANKVNNDSTCYLRKTVAGTETTLGTYLATAGTHTLRATANGSTISMDVDGTERVSVTDTAISSGTYVGIEAYSNANERWNDWSAADLAAGSAAASSIGSATAIGVGSARTTSVANANSVSTAIVVGRAATASVANSVGVSTAIAVGAASIQGSAASSTGSGSAASIGSSANTGVANAVGTATAIGIANSSSSSVANAAGAATAIAVGAATTNGPAAASSSATSSATATGSAMSRAAASSAGGATAIAVGVDASAVVAKKFGPRGRKIAERQKKKQLELELRSIVQQDEDDIEVIKVAFRAAVSEYFKMAA